MQRLVDRALVVVQKMQDEVHVAIRYINASRVGTRSVVLIPLTLIMGAFDAGLYKASKG